MSRSKAVRSCVGENIGKVWGPEHWQLEWHARAMDVSRILKQKNGKISKYLLRMELSRDLLSYESEERVKYQAAVMCCKLSLHTLHTEATRIACNRRRTMNGRSGESALPRHHITFSGNKSKK